MLRTCAALSVCGLLALVFFMALNSGGGTVSSLLPGTAASETTMTPGDQPLTLEAVRRDAVWRSDVLRKLRELD